MLQGLEYFDKPSFFDDAGSLDGFSFWKKPAASNLKKLSEIKHIEGNLFKKSRKSSFWKSRYYILYEDRLAYFKNSRTTTESGHCLLQNMRIETCNSSEREEKFGVRFIHNGQKMELYARSEEIQSKWMDKLKGFCVLRDYTTQYTPLKVIGEGSFAKVYLSRRKTDGVEMAVKTFEKKQLGMADKNKVSLLNEISIMRKLNHESIVKLHEIHETDSHIYLVLELLKGSELFKRIVKKRQFRECEASALMKKLLSALDYLHSRNIVHRDIKPENLILTGHDNDYDIKIADFGLSALLATSDETLFKRCGTPGYVAPEILADEKYDHKVDIFSAGAVLYILLTGKFPFHGYSCNEIILKNMLCHVNFDFKEMRVGVSDLAADLVKKMMAKNPLDRPTAKQCLQHPWISSITIEKADGSRFGLLSSAEKNMGKYQNEARFNVKNIKPKDLDQNPTYLGSPQVHARIGATNNLNGDLDKLNKIPEHDSNEYLKTEEIEQEEKKSIPFSQNFNLISSINSNSTNSSLNTPKANFGANKNNNNTQNKGAGLQSYFVNFLRNTPDESKQDQKSFLPVVQEKKERNVQRNVANVKSNLRNLF